MGHLHEDITGIKPLWERAYDWTDVDFEAVKVPKSGQKLQLITTQRASCSFTSGPHIPHEADKWEESSLLWGEAADQTSGLLARPCEACRCLLFGRGSTAVGRPVGGWHESVHILQTADRPNELCQHLVEGYRGRFGLDELLVWICFWKENKNDKKKCDSWKTQERK